VRSAKRFVEIVGLLLSLGAWNESGDLIRERPQRIRARHDCKFVPLAAAGDRIFIEAANNSGAYR
jgi:hypothetical protein